MTPRDTHGVSAQNAKAVIRNSGRLRQINVKLGVQLQRKAFAQLKSHALVIAVVQKKLGFFSSHNDDAWSNLSKACMQAADSSCCCSCCRNRQLASSHQADNRSWVSPAAAAMMQTCSLTASGSGLQCRLIDLYIDSHLNQSECAAKGSRSCTTERRQGDCNSSGEIQPSSAVGSASRKQQMQGGLSEVLLDDEWKALEEAQFVV